MTTCSGLFQGGRVPTAFSPRPLVPDERPGPSLLSEAPRIDRVSLSGSSPPFRQCRCFCCFCFKHLLFWLSRIQARASPYRFGCRLSPGPASVRCLPKSRAVGGGDSVDGGDSASGYFGWRICKQEPQLRSNSGACDAGPAPALLGPVWVPVTLQGSSKKGQEKGLSLEARQTSPAEP